jgi:hypothetical protein
MTTWTCEELDRWLDDGRPEGTRDLGEAHATACARCREALAAALDVERALALPEPASRAPAAFTDAVMQRVSMTSRDLRPAPPSLAGWLLADPAAATACVLGFLVVWWREPLWVLALTISARAVALVPLISEQVAFGVLDAFASPAALAGLALALLPLIGWGSWLLMRWCERATAGALDGLSLRYIAPLAEPTSTS